MVLEATGILSFVLTIVVIGLVFWLLLWLIDFVGLPEPFNKVAKVILAVVAVLLLINFLLGLTGAPFIRLR
jgi:hypothetical protein